MKLSTKQLMVFGVFNFFLIILISFFINYAYSKIYWHNRISIRSELDSSINEIKNTNDSITEAYIAKSYKIGTSFEIFKKKDPLLKIVSNNDGALEFAVASGNNHFSNLAKAGDGVIRKVGEGNLIFSIPSYTDKNNRSIIFGNESKIIIELKNSDNIIINSRNFSVNLKGVVTANDFIINNLNREQTMSDFMLQIKNQMNTINRKVVILENEIIELKKNH